MQVAIQYRPAHALAVVTLAPGEPLRAEAGAMVSMSGNVVVETQGPGAGSGGLFKGLKRALLGGESFFTNRFHAQGGAGEVTLAPSLSGDMTVHHVQPGEELFIQSSSYVGGADTILLDTQFQGLKGLFSGETLFFLKATGQGPLIMSAFGALEAIDLDGELIVDTGHLVAFTSGLDYEIGKASRGLIASFLSGEGLVLRMRGRGRLYLQTRNPNDFGRTVGQLLPPRQQ